ncbi:MAG: DUF4011 domain-containing protein, partial [Candidatus Zixiibacteriota bacterium]
MASTFSDRLRESKKNLLDLSLRNSLLNYRLGTRRGIQVVEESSKEIFEILVRQKKTMAFKPATETRDPIVQKDKQKRKSLKYPLTDSWLQTSLSDESLQTKLLATFLDATTYIEERGVNILFLSLGALKWYEDEKSTKELTAPLLLIPVTLERTSAREKFTLKYNDEDLEGNLSLSEKVRQDFGIMYPSFPNGDDLDVPAYFDQVKRSVERLTRWHVEADEIALGFFSFGKFLMYKDLDENTWPKGMEPDKHPILGTLLGDGFRDEDPFYSTEELLDPHWTPKNDFQVVDADSSQLLAILEISKGKNLVLQGPPGTGKSQTITNLIADALGNGKKVLFVSEKMAALEVVKRRLDQIGLGCACLELHSHKANKKLLLKELNQTLALGKPTYELEPQTYDSYTMLRETLNNYSNALHTPINNTGYTPFRVIGELIELEQLLKGVSIPSLRKLQITELVIGVWNKSNFKSWLDVLSRMQSHIQKMGMPETHPFYKSRAVSLLPSDKQSIRISLESSISTCEIHIRKFQELSELTDIRLPVNKRSLDVLLRVLGRAMDAPDLSEIHVCSKLWASKRNEIIKLLTLGAEYSRIYNGYSPRIIQGSWKSDVSKAHATLRKYSGSWWRVFLREYRDGRNQICKLCTDPTNESAQSLTDIASAIVEASRLQIMLSSHDSTARELFGSRWRGGFSDWQSLSQVAEWIMALHADIETNGINPGILSFLEQSSDKTQIDLLSIVARESATHFELARKQAFDWLSMDENWRKQFDEENFSDQLSVLKIMLANIDKLSDHVTFSNLQIEVAECGHSWLLDICDSWEGAANHLASFFKFAWFEELLRHVYSERQILQGFVGEKRSQALREFIRLDQRLLELNRHRLASLHWERLPKYSVDGQRGILLREFEKKSRHLSIRQLIEKAGTAVQAIKPVFMMSPMSIASFLPHAGIVFDIVIFDEASQVKPVDAFGALLRARQSVIVGDSKQLPPTNFFDSIAGNSDTENSEDDEADLTSDLESILGMMKSRGVLERSLRWHYRSRHESLIAFSNFRF